MTSYISWLGRGPRGQTVDIAVEHAEGGCDQTPRRGSPCRWLPRHGRGRCRRWSHLEPLSATLPAMSSSALNLGDTRWLEGSCLPRRPGRSHRRGCGRPPRDGWHDRSRSRFERRHRWRSSLALRWSGCSARGASTSASSRIGLAVSGRKAKALVIPGSSGGKAMWGTVSTFEFGRASVCTVGAMDGEILTRRVGSTLLRDLETRIDVPTEGRRRSQSIPRSRSRSSGTSPRPRQMTSWRRCSEHA